MIKKHDVIGFITSSIEDAVNHEEVIMVGTERHNNQLDVTFTEKDLTETKYRITIELID